MSLSRLTVNPLSVLSVRKLSFIPEHFSCVTIKGLDLDIKMLDYWINYNLNSRYAIKKTVVLDNNKIVEAIEIGIENPTEITMMTLGCPYLHTT